MGFGGGLGASAMVGCPAFESAGFSFTENFPGSAMEQWCVGPRAWPHSGVCSVALGGGFCAGLDGAGRDVLWRSCTVSVRNCSWA